MATRGGDRWLAVGDKELRRGRATGGGGGWQVGAGDESERGENEMRYMKVREYGEAPESDE